MSGSILGPRVGVYEKSLPAASWTDTFVAASRAGYGFLELAIDESPERIARLEWSAQERVWVRAASLLSGVAIGTITLSAQRAFPMGSADASVRRRSLRLARQAVELAADLEAPLVQLAGYFTFYEPAHALGRCYFVDGLAQVADRARTLGVRLAIENVDGRDVTRVEDALSLIADSCSADVVGLYVDVGNCVGNGLDPVAELRLAGPALAAVQFKDARPGEFRRVPFGAGDVPWAQVFAFLGAQRYRGPVAVEMWNDDGDPRLAADALSWLWEAGLDEVVEVTDESRGARSPAACGG